MPNNGANRTFSTIIDLNPSRGGTRCTTQTNNFEKYFGSDTEPKPLFFFQIGPILISKPKIKGFISLFY